MDRNNKLKLFLILPNHKQVCESSFLLVPVNGGWSICASFYLTFGIALEIVCPVKMQNYYATKTKLKKAATDGLQSAW